MSGDAHLLLLASAREREAISARNTREAQGYIGDVRTLEQMREAFRLGAYDQVVQLASALRLPEKMTESQRRMLELAKLRSK
jgi:hypothetical protein